jgi:hypothetical protein
MDAGRGAQIVLARKGDTGVNGGQIEARDE